MPSGANALHSSLLIDFTGSICSTLGARMLVLPCSAKRSRQVGRPRAAAPEEEGLGGKIEINEEDLIADEQDRQRCVHF